MSDYITTRTLKKYIVIYENKYYLIPITHINLSKVNDKTYINNLLLKHQPIDENINDWIVKIIIIKRKEKMFLIDKGFLYKFLIIQ